MYITLICEGTYITMCYIKCSLSSGEGVTLPPPCNYGGGSVKKGCGNAAL